MTLDLQVAPDAAAAARRVGLLIAERAREAVETRGEFSVAVSKAPPEMLRALAESDVLWARTSVYQVDERVAAPGHRDRNLTHLLAALPQEARERVQPMPVADPDLEEAAARYAARLRPLDLVHLGLGPDGHTASLVPGDPVLAVHDRQVAITGVYQGRRRMTLTYPALEAAREIVWLVTGEDKREVLARLLERDPAIPASAVTSPRQLVVADAAAAPARGTSRRSGGVERA